MVVARTAAARESLAGQFLQRTVFKGYLALVTGMPGQEGGLIARPIGRHPNNRKRFSSRFESGRTARTLWRTVTAREGFSLMAVRILTGRTHQIRVHLSDDGFPVAGDDLYCPGWRKRVSHPELVSLVRFPLLHAALLSFTHPESGQRMTRAAPLPLHFRQAVELLFPNLPEDLESRTTQELFFPRGAQ